jgi:hypothetical protein
MVDTAGQASTRHEARYTLAHHKEIGDIEEAARGWIAKLAFFSRFVIGHHGDPSLGFSSYTRASIDVLVMEAPMENPPMLPDPTIRFLRGKTRSWSGRAVMVSGHASDVNPMDVSTPMSKERSIRALW